MAVRTPLKLDGSNIREMTSSEITAIKNRCVYLYGADPSVDVSVVSSSGNISPVMTDTRQRASVGVSNQFNFHTQSELSGFGAFDAATYDKISQTIESVSQDGDTNSRRNFLYQSGGNIYAMTHTDMYDTFYNDAIDLLISSGDQDGTYRIGQSTSASPTLTDHTLVSSTPVFTDTRANVSAYTRAGLIETRDQPTTILHFYLFRTNQGTQGTPSITGPLYITSDTHIREHTTSSADAILQADIRYWGAQKIRYNVNGSGTNKGDLIVNTVLNGSGNYQTRQFGADDYRAQIFPNGTSVNSGTFRLKITRV